MDDKKGHHDDAQDIGNDHQLQDVQNTNDRALQPKAEHDGE